MDGLINIHWGKGLLMLRYFYFQVLGIRQHYIHTYTYTLVHTPFTSPFALLMSISSIYPSLPPNPNSNRPVTPLLSFLARPFLAVYVEVSLWAEWRRGW